MIKSDQPTLNLDHALGLDEDPEDNDFIPMVDLMSVLMILFLFISISLWQNVVKLSNSQSVMEKSISLKIEQAINGVVNSSNIEWQQDNNSVIFNTPFNGGKAEVPKKLQIEVKATCNLLAPLFEEYVELIQEVRVEGHTNSVFGDRRNDNSLEGFAHNMDTSQKRAYNTMSHCINNSVIGQNIQVRKLFISAGMASKRPVLNEQGQEDITKSKRVEFVIVYKSHNLINPQL